MLPELAQRMSLLQPSATLAVNAKAKALRAEGKAIINLSVGEPDFDTPEFIKQAAVQALQQGRTKYTAVDGIAELKQAVCDKFQRENSLSYRPEQIIVSTGAKQSIFNCCMALLNQGDEVIIPAPYWVSYPEMVKFAGAKPVYITTRLSDRFKLKPEQLAAAISDHTKLFILNSPSNPSGMAYSLEQLKALAEVLQKHPQVWILSDDIYEHILWGQPGFYNILNACPALYERTIIVNGVSKAYAMTGWRIGYAAANPALVKAMSKIQSQATSNPNSIAQYAAVTALEQGSEAVAEMREIYLRRHALLQQGIAEIDGIEALDCDGTFYLFADVSKACDKLGLEDDAAFCNWLLDNCEIAAVPGSSFGAAKHIRLSYAVSETELQQAIDRLKAKL